MGLASELMSDMNVPRKVPSYNLASAEIYAAMDALLTVGVPPGPEVREKKAKGVGLWLVAAGLVYVVGAGS